MSELADASGRDVFNIRDSLENMGLLHDGQPTRVAIEHNFAVAARGDSGREYTQWHPDTLLLLGVSPESQQPDLFTCWDPDEFNDASSTGDDHEWDSQTNNDDHEVQKTQEQHLSGSASVGTIRPGFDAIIATDGACSGNPGPGGWAWVEQISGARDSGGQAHTTNNIMELTAMIQALEYVPSDCSLLIRADSQYVINVMTKWAVTWRRKGWKKADGSPVANRDLVERLLTLYERRKGATKVEWVRGHAGDAANELVDSMAVQQSRAHAK